MIKKINTFLFKSTRSEKNIILKDIFFTHENENISRLIRLIKKTENKIDPNAVILDVGAFDGGTAKLLSKAFPSSKVLAFEANPEVYKMALANCSDFKNISLHNCAISGKKETLDFYVTNNNVSSSLNQINDNEVDRADYKNELNMKKKVSVSAQKLDEFIGAEEILLLKVDTQGHELQVLAGAAKTLKKTAYVLIEMSNHNMYVNGCKYHEVDECLRNNNFTLADVIVTYRKKGLLMTEYDAIYINNNKHVS